jgi:hypothetical protein
LGLEEVEDVLKAGDFLGKDGYLWGVVQVDNQAAISFGMKADTLYFIDYDKLQVLASIPKASITQSSVRKTCLALYTPLPPGSADGSGGDDAIESFGLNPWGLFTLSFDMPWWAWAAIAGGAAIGSNSSRTKVGMVILGGVAVVAGGNAVTAYRKKTKKA